MPAVSKTTAPVAEQMGSMQGHYGQLADYTVGFESYGEDLDAAPVFAGLPDDRCQSQHWGYVVSGAITLRYADHEETYRAGDAYYAPPGHTPAVTAGSEIVEFSPTAALQETMAVVARNVAALHAARA